ncbi:MAG: hypothetical protein V4591_10110 [Bdellovibrionota bacterium]
MTFLTPPPSPTFGKYTAPPTPRPRPPKRQKIGESNEARSSSSYGFSFCQIHNGSSQPLPSNSTGKIFCIDFDKTITNQNIHDLCGLISYEDRVDLFTSIKEQVNPIGEEGQWCRILTNLVNSGHFIAIVSFNEYPKVMLKFLEESVALEPKILEQICIITRFSTDKNMHIERAVGEYMRRGGRAYPTCSDIVLIDDNSKNIEAAKRKGYKTLLAAGEFLVGIENFFSKSI